MPTCNTIQQQQSKQRQYLNSEKQSPQYRDLNDQTTITLAGKQPGTGATVELPSRKYLFPPLYPCHYKIQRAGFIGIWIGMHAAILSYFVAKNVKSDWTEGLDHATQYGILTSLMGILLAMSPTFLGILRRTPLNQIVTFEKRVHAHKFMSYILFVWTITHASLHYWSGIGYADSIHASHTYVFWQDRIGITGQLMWMFFLLIGLAALPIVRRVCYEAFYYIHHLYLVNLALLYVHSENGKAVRFITGPLCIFVADYLYRVVRSYPLFQSRRARIRYIKFHPSNVVELGFDRRELIQRSRIGQYVKVCVPELGIFQWHPFTLTATPNESKVLADGKRHGIWRIHFKVAGNWTSKLSQRLQQVTAGGDAYTNNFDQEARIGRVVNDVVVPEVAPIRCSERERDEEYVMAMANHIDVNDSAVAVDTASMQSTTNVANITIDTTATATASNNDQNLISPIDGERACRLPLAANSEKKGEYGQDSRFSQDSSISGSSNQYDEGWISTGFTGSNGHRQVALPTILVDGPYNAPMETFFEYHVNIVIAAGIGITPYIAALDRVLELCENSIPTRTTQHTREELLPQTIYIIWVFRDISLLSVVLPTLQRLRECPRARNIVVPCIYVTGSVDTQHEGAISDVFGRPMIKLSNGIRVSQGRPPVSRMVSYMAGKHPNASIGVFSCAPKEMAAQVRSTVHDTNAAIAHQGTHMSMRAECFSM